MYAVMGVTGQVGSAVAENLLALGKKIRVVVRDPEKAASWGERGAEIAVADYADAAALTEAFRGAEGVFGMIPPYFAPAPGFPEARAVIAAIKAAIVATRPGRAVYLSTIGAQRAERSGLLMSLHILEEELSQVGVPSAFLRAGWFMENSLWDVPSAKNEGKIDSFCSRWIKSSRWWLRRTLGEWEQRLCCRRGRGTGTSRCRGRRSIRLWRWPWRSRRCWGTR